MVGDITYIETWEGWLYLATVIDCATRKIVGWAMDDNYKTPLIVSAVEMAARNLDLPEGAIFHSDRGSNYTSGDFAKVLKRLKIRQSVGRTGICYDNALAESFNGTLKNELVYRTVYPTWEKAGNDIARWIELRYNRTRLSFGVARVLRDVALDGPVGACATRLWGCGVRRRCCSNASHHLRAPLAQHLWRNFPVFGGR